MHPFSKAAKDSYKSKTKSMGKLNNLDIPIMRAVGENKAGGVHESKATMQHADQAASAGMKLGGRVKHDGTHGGKHVPPLPVKLPHHMSGIMAGANGLGRMRKAKKYGP